jgi:hypothetical protein
MGVHDRIQLFTSYFRRQVDLIDSLDGNEALMDRSPKEFGLALQRKILFSAILDSLASCRYYGQRLKNTERFIGIVHDHGDWPEGGLVSTLVLSERLKKSGFWNTALHARAQAKLRSVHYHSGISLSLNVFDEPLVNLEAIAQDDEEKHVLKKTEHFQLFYKYRNYLVHEYREPGYAWEALSHGEDRPSYQFISTSGTRGSALRLVYPANFFRRIVLSVIGSLGIWFSQNAIDPYERLEDTTAWIEP